jgi:hypothetical protein
MPEETKLITMIRIVVIFLTRFGKIDFWGSFKIMYVVISGGASSSDVSSRF